MTLKSFETRIPKLINRLGRDILIRSFVNTGSDFDPVLTPTDTPAIGAFFDYDASETDGTTIQKDDVLILVGAPDVVTKQDKIVDAAKPSQELNIISVESVGPGDKNFYYRIQARG